MSDDVRLLTVADVARETQFSETTVYRVLKSRELRGAKMGGRGDGAWRVHPDDLRAWYERSVPRDGEAAPLAARAPRRQRQGNSRRGSLRALAAADPGRT